MADTPNPAAAPAPQTPAEAPAAVPIQLGPDTAIYGDAVKPEPATETPTPESAEPGATETPPETQDRTPAEDATPSTDDKGSRRKKGDEAYERGLREGREKAERDRQEREQAAATEHARQQAQARYEKLVEDLESPDFQTSENAKRELTKVLKPDKQAQAIQTQTRMDVLNQLAESFKAVRDLEGVDDAGYQALHAAKDPADLAKNAYDLGRKAATGAAEERIAGLEAELETLRGRSAGRALSPEKATGSTGGGPQMTLDQYQALSPKEARKLPAHVIDEMTRRLLSAPASRR